MKIYNEVTPSCLCPVCQAVIPPVRPGGMGVNLDIPNTDPGNVICITVCFKCYTFLDYNVTKDSVAITKTETLKEFEKKDPAFSMFKMAAIILMERERSK